MAIVERVWLSSNPYRRRRTCRVVVEPVCHRRTRIVVVEPVTLLPGSIGLVRLDVLVVWIRRRLRRWAPLILTRLEW